MASPDVKRCFVALAPDDAVRTALADAAAAPRIKGLRLTPAANLHLTLKFLGNVHDDDVPDVIEALHLGVDGVEPFDMVITGVLYLPHQRRPRVLAAGLEPDPALMRLQKQTEHALAAVGYPPEQRAFRPHITLGRFKSPPRKPLPEIELAPHRCRIAHATLMASQLTADGPIYTPLEQIELPGDRV
jgi:2'-5' RNA ligase